ncbi:MAG: purine-nucleoside phosphorylase, partial [Lachnospiraceae bacterium]|nr:purine-nucleoside phosphorylase [Lachnospiraceae bacterium]
MAKESPSACIKVEDGTHVAKCVLMPGDPLRAKYVAEHYLEDAVLFNSVRNMFGYTGTYKGKEVSVMGSGMGIPSMVLYAHELFNFFGVEAIIRIGSAGGIADSVHLRDVLIAMSASTNSDVGSAYDLPGVMAPTADWELFKTAVEVAEEKGVAMKAGSIFSTDVFLNPDPDTNVKLRDAGIL